MYHQIIVSCNLLKLKCDMPDDIEIEIIRRVFKPPKVRNVRFKTLARIQFVIEFLF